jgi:hypothetical protein
LTISAPPLRVRWAIFSIEARSTRSLSVMPLTVQYCGIGTIESPCAPSTMVFTSITELCVACAMNQENRALSSTPAMPITRCDGKPVLTRARCTIESSGLVTTITKASGE